MPQPGIVAPAVTGLGLFGSHVVIHVPHDLVSHLGHLHQAAVVAQDVQILAQNTLDLLGSFAHLPGGYIAPGMVIVGNTAVDGSVVAKLPPSTVIPDIEHVVLGRILGGGPLHELHQFVVVAHIDLAQVLDDRRADAPAGIFPDQVPFGGTVLPINLDNDVDPAGRADLLHLVHVRNPEAVQVVVGIEKHHDRPIGHSQGR